MPLSDAAGDQRTSVRGTRPQGRDKPSVFYVVVTPAYNEEQYIERTIASMASQTLQPIAWVVVDDGSTDRTWSIIERAANMTPFLAPLRRTRHCSPVDDGLLFASEAAAFKVGLRKAVSVYGMPDYVVKLDADLEFGEEYFALLMSKFENDPRLGIAGGRIWEWQHGKLVEDPVARHHVRGATKVYRWACFEDIGGLRQVFGWDVIDEMLARQKGWHVRSFEEPRLVHLRPTASRDGRFKGWARNGQMAYYVGYDLVYFALRIAYRLVVQRDAVQATGLAWGFLRSWLRRDQRLEDREIRRVVKQEQRRQFRNLLAECIGNGGDA